MRYVRRIAFMLAALLFAGVQGSMAATTTLTVLEYQQTMMDLDQRAAARFEQSHPDVKVDIKLITGDYISEVFSLIAGGVAPDVVIRDIGGTPLSWFLDGQLVNLTPFINADRAHFKSWLPTLIDQATVAGRTYEIPRPTMQIYVPWFRKSLFDNAGLSYPDGSWDFAGFRGDLRKLTRDKNGDGTTDQFGYRYAWEAWQPFLFSNGGGTVDVNDPTQLLIGNAGSREALEFLAQLRYQDQVMPADTSLSSSHALKDFSAGTVAVVLRPTNFYAQLPAEIRGDLGISLGPKGQGTRHTMTVQNGFVIPSASTHQQLAFELIEAMTDRDAQVDAATIGGSQVVDQSVNQIYMHRDVGVLGYAQTLDQAVLQPAFSGSKMMPDTANDLVESFIQDSIITNKLSVSAALDTYLPQIQNEMKPFIAGLGALSGK